MATVQTLRDYLRHWADYNEDRVAIAKTVTAIAAAAGSLSRTIARGSLSEDLARTVGDNADGDQQKYLDLKANDLFLSAARAAPVQCFGSEEFDDVMMLDPEAPLALAIDPLDGSSNIETNVSIGTIFSIRPAAGETSFLGSGNDQLAAGFVIYGPQTLMVFTTGAGALTAMFDPETSQFVMTGPPVRIREGKTEFAINSSNYRHWPSAVRAYIDDCINGQDGPRGVDYNVRWIASLVAETYRILVRGGVFLYPADQRKGYAKGRLRLVYEAQPIAMLIEQAGGMATDGLVPILSLHAESLHERTPLVFGDATEVERIARYHTDESPIGVNQPLFGRRGLFRA